MSSSVESPELWSGPAPAPAPKPEPPGGYPAVEHDPECAICSCPCCDGLPAFQLYENFTHRPLTGLTQTAWHTRAGPAAPSGEEDPFAKYLRDNPDMLVAPPYRGLVGAPGLSAPSFPPGHLQGFRPQSFGQFEVFGWAWAGGVGGFADPVQTITGGHTGCRQWLDPNTGEGGTVAIPAFATSYPKPDPGYVVPTAVSCVPPGVFSRDGTNGIYVRNGGPSPASEVFPRPITDGRGSGVCARSCVLRPNFPMQPVPFWQSSELVPFRSGPIPRPPAWDDRAGLWLDRWHHLSDYTVYLAPAPVTESGVARRQIPQEPIDWLAGPLTGDPVLDSPTPRPLPPTVRVRVSDRSGTGGFTLPPDELAIRVRGFAVFMTGGRVASPAMRGVTPTLYGGPSFGVPVQWGFSDALEVAGTGNKVTLRLGLGDCDQFVGQTWVYAGFATCTYKATFTVGPCWAYLPFPGAPGFHWVMVHPGGTFEVECAGVVLLSYSGAAYFTGRTDVYLYSLAAPSQHLPPHNGTTCPDGTHRRILHGPGTGHTPFHLGNGDGGTTGPVTLFPDVPPHIPDPSNHGPMSLMLWAGPDLGPLEVGGA